jgi:hypothetical protein
MVVLSWMQRRREKYEGREVGKLGTEGVSRMTKIPEHNRGFTKSGERGIARLIGQALSSASLTEVRASFSCSKYVLLALYKWEDWCASHPFLPHRQALYF